MTDPNKLAELRRQAEKAVEDIPSGELKVKAFEVILARLLGSTETLAPRSRQRTAKGTASLGTIPARILAEQGEGFFKSQRTIAEIQDRLRSRGWHYPQTTLSGRLQSLVQQGKLRRERVKQGSKKVWKYSNP